MPSRDPARAGALASLLNYLTPHADSMWYKQRLAEGRPIGWGLIEGQAVCLLAA